MNDSISLDYQINRLGFWCVIIALATTVVSFFLPSAKTRIDRQISVIPRGRIHVS